MKIYIKTTIQFFTIIYLLLDLSVFSQPLSVKERYDSEKLLFINNNYTDGTKITSQGNLGDGMTNILESWLRMYQVTKDKAYLIKFANEAIQIMELRGTYDINQDNCDGFTVNSPFAFSSCLYHNGLILWALSHYAYFVEQEEPSLEFEPIYQTGKIANNKFNESFFTYGQVGYWLTERVRESMDYFISDYWISNIRGFHNQNETRPMNINMQSGFGAALFYLGKSSASINGFIYLDKAAGMAQAYKGTYSEDHRNPPFGCIFPTNHIHPIFETINGADIWKWNGWREQTCSETDEGKNDYEDASHAIQTLIFPQAINLKPVSGSVIEFDNTNMLKFRNTFTHQIFHQYTNGCPQFHACVDGDDVNNDPDGPSGLNNPEILKIIFAWMPFYKMDAQASPPNVYDILSDYYKNCWNNVVDYGTTYLGLSEVANAQWDIECANLTLYNRDVVYDQDFFVKNTLTIAPQQTTDAYYTPQPFAEPQTFTDGGAQDRFVIEPGVNVNMVAGEKIILKGGFHAKAGSRFHAYINPNVCTDGVRMENTQNTTPSDPVVLQTAAPSAKKNTEKEIQEESVLNSANENIISPNPSSGIFTFTCKEPLQNIEIMDVLGNVIYKSENLNPKSEINISAQPKGIYFLKAYNAGGKIYTEKVVIQ